MALYDAKIERFSKKAEQLEKNIKRDTEERRRNQNYITSLRDHKAALSLALRKAEL